MGGNLSLWNTYVNSNYQSSFSHNSITVSLAKELIYGSGAVRQTRYVTICNWVCNWMHT